MWIKFEPLERGSGFIFEDETVGGSVPKEFVPSVEKGLKMQKEDGVLARFPTVDFKATLVDGSYHEVDSNAMTFEIAAKAAFREAVKKAGPILLEPMMRVETIVPDDFVGDAVGDFSSRRGLVEGMESRNGGIQAVRALIPLSEMFGYATTLRSMSQGRVTYSMEFAHYAEAPRNVAEAIIASRAE